MATYYIALELGIATGAMSSGLSQAAAIAVTTAGARKVARTPKADQEA